MVVSSYRLFGTTNLFHRQSSNPRKMPGTLRYWGSQRTGHRFARHPVTAHNTACINCVRKCSFFLECLPSKSFYFLSLWEYMYQKWGEDIGWEISEITWRVNWRKLWIIPALLLTDGILAGETWAAVNHLTPNGHYMGRTAQSTSRCCILYIYSTNTRIRTEYFKHAA